MCTQRALRLLKNAPVFQGVQQTYLEPLVQVAQFQHYQRGQHLFYEGDAVQKLYFVEQGSIRVYRVAKAGKRELTLHVEGPRQMVAGLAVFQGQSAIAPANAQVLQTPTSTLILPTDLVLNTVFQTPVLAQAVIGFYARRQADLLSRIDKWVFSELGQRLAIYLLAQKKQPHTLPTNHELAALLGTVPELISRKLGEFYRLGFIQLERRTVTICQADKLEELAQDE